jgi:hypothetical protein
LGIAPEHDIDQAANHGLALQFNKGFGLGNAFLCQP